MKKVPVILPKVTVIIRPLFFWCLLLIILFSCKQNPPTSIVSHEPFLPAQKDLGQTKENQEIPVYVIETLSYIRKNKRPQHGFVGGRKFNNREKRLPIFEDGKKIFYQEWDVKRKIKGKNRGPERLITSKHTAYYTPDHYNTFILIKENK